MMGRAVSAVTLLLVGATVLPSIVTVIVVGLVISNRPELPLIDGWWHSVMLGFRHPVLDGLSHFLAVWGEKGLGFGVVPAILVVVLVATRRSASVPGFLVAGVVSLIVVQSVKPLLGRARPEDIIVPSDAGSFPSGHVANVATLGIFIALVYARVWVWALSAGYLVLMAFSRLYLHAHWLTDVLGGAVLGGAIGYAGYVLSTTPAAEALSARLTRRLGRRLSLR